VDGINICTGQLRIWHHVVVGIVEKRFGIKVDEIAG